MLHLGMLLRGFGGFRFGHPAGATCAAWHAVPFVAWTVPVHLRLILFQDCYLHVPAPGIEPDTSSLSGKRTSVVLDGEQAPAGSLASIGRSTAGPSTYSAGAPGLLSVSRQFRMPFLLQLPARSGSGSESVGHAWLKPAIT